MGQGGGRAGGKVGVCWGPCMGGGFWLGVWGGGLEGGKGWRAEGALRGSVGVGGKGLAGAGLLQEDRGGGRWCPAWTVESGWTRSQGRKG